MKKQHQYPLLEGLMTSLESEGFAISLDMIIRIQGILETQGSQYRAQPENLKRILCPIIAKSDVEQQKFYRIFDTWFTQLQKDQDPPTLPLSPEDHVPARIRLRTVFIGVILFAALFFTALAGWIYYKANQTQNEPTQTDTPPPEEKKSDCPSVEKPPSDFTVSTTQANVGDTIYFTLGPEVEKLKNDLVIRWYMGDGDSILTDESTIQHSFQQAGIYWVFLAAGYKNTNFCYTYSQQAIQISHPDSKITLPELAYLSPVIDTEPFTSEYNWVRALLTLFIISLPLLSIGFFLQWHKRLKQNAAAAANTIIQQKRKEEALANAKGGKGAPFNLVFSAQNQHIEVVQEIYEVSNALRQRQLADVLVLDISDTIYQTIRAGGMPKVSYRFLSEPTEYLALIDHTTRNDHRAQLFESWMDTMAMENVNVVKYFFRHDPRVCWGKDFPDGISIETLFQRYPEHRLMVMSNANYLLQPFRAELKDWALTCFEGWSRKILVTPTEPAEWSYQEKLLSKIMTIVPANKQGQLALAELLSADETTDFTKLRTRFTVSSITIPVPVSAQQTAEDIDWDALMQYLTLYNEEGVANSDLYLLLCASAAYSPLTWEMTLALAKALADNGLIQKSTLAHHHLLRLFNLPWMQEGVIPEDVRLRLEEDLSQNIAAELIVRQTIIAQLDSLNLPPNSLALRKQQQQIGLQMIATENALTNADNPFRHSNLYKGETNKFANQQQTEQTFMQEETAQAPSVNQDELLTKIRNWFTERLSANAKPTDEVPEFESLYQQEMRNRNQWKLSAQQLKQHWWQVKHWNWVNYATLFSILVLWLSTLSITSTELVNKTPAVLNNLGVEVFAKNELDSALAYFDQAHRLDTSYFIARNNLALINYRQGIANYYANLPEQAIAKFQNTAKLVLNSDVGLHALHHIGVCHYQLGATDSSKYYYDRIAETDTAYFYRFIPNLAVLLGIKQMSEKDFPPRSSAPTAGIAEPRGMAFSIDGNFLLTGASSNDAALLSVPSMQVAYLLQGHSAPVWNFTYSNNMQYALTGSLDHSAKLWNTKNQYELEHVFEGHAEAVLSVAFSPSGFFALTGSKDKTVKVWNLATKENIHTFTDHTGPVWSVGYSPDGKFIVTASADGVVYIYNSTDFSQVKQLTEHYSGVMAAAFSPIGNQLATGSADGIINLWKMPSFELTSTFVSDTNGVSSLSYSPDGRYLLAGAAGINIGIYINDQDTSEGDYITGSDVSQSENDPMEGMVHLFTTDWGSAIKIFPGAKAAFSPDGQFIAIAQNKRIHLHYANLYVAMKAPDLCYNKYCGEQGTCNPQTGLCDCRNGYTGEHCEIPPPINDPCKNVNCGANGTCVNGTCRCKNGYTGNRCQTSPKGDDICAELRCSENGTCNPITKVCDCKPGYSGRRCQLKSGLCNDVNCGNNGTCNPQTGKCVCKNGYTGERCQTPPDLCKGINCGAYGDCNPQTGKCDCRNGYTGDRCQTPPADTPVQQTTQQVRQQALIQNLSDGKKFDFVDTKFTENLLRVRNGGKWFYVNEQGNPAYPNTYFDEAGDFVGGRAKVKLSGYTFYINRNGKCVADCPNDPKLNIEREGK
jgi:tetratricopeptide (TPR) repeat protein